ncbi:hypothetical protein [Vibrio vulnificus]|uniref:hypothetical protein n=1 Tax=Vibrio vulnificus TaxID=672 RepID=UPI0006AD2515|nr:hypothetical protein [Vibrio vulnificus]EGQ9325796.1 hypothetical protein [Vibrio cholerae]EGR0161914.1 hypothetical protein [Vibrio cholerae]EKZ8642280.1 hypothetical protein [Vibrio cholerae]KOR97338.1 hypothetical protein LO82_14020 [Vibrio vulnificus]OQK37934.1 hypothetical protein XM74_c20648 [Vibrio vulnificus]
MPLPFILAGAAIVAGGYGVKKGIDAKDDFDTAKRVNRRAQSMFDEAKSELEEERELTQKAMENLGQAKYRIYNESIIPFVDVFSKIKNVSFEDNNLDDATNLPVMSAGELARMKSSVLEIKGVLSGGITALGSGGLAGLAAYGGVGVLGTASTGTAIGTLSGAAATNATLAWLGGGSLAAGGYGMAGGMMVLGGVVAGPVLAVGGMMMASKAEAAKEDAYGNLDKAELASEQMKEARVAASGIRLRFEEITKVLRSLELRFQPLLQSLNELVESNTNYSTYSEEDRKGVMIAASTAKVLKNLLEAPIIDKEGTLTPESRKVLEETKKIIA